MYVCISACEYICICIEVIYFHYYYHYIYYYIYTDYIISIIYTDGWEFMGGQVGGREDVSRETRMKKTHDDVHIAVCCLLALSALFGFIIIPRPCTRQGHASSHQYQTFQIF